MGSAFDGSRGKHSLTSVFFGCAEWMLDEFKDQLSRHHANDTKPRKTGVQLHGFVSVTKAVSGSSISRGVMEAIAGGVLQER